MADLLDFAPVRVFTSNAAPGAGYVARFFQSGTTTPVTVYSDSALTTPLGTSVTANAEGKFPAVWSTGGAIKCTISTPAGAVVDTIDPVQSITSGAAATNISFNPTVALPFTNVQTAIEGAAASAASGFTPFGLGVTGSVALLANIDAPNIASGQYRFDGTTAGTYPTGVAAADTGAISMIRETSGSGWMVLYHDTTDRTWFRRLNSSAWGAWRENLTSNQPLAAGDLFFRGASNVQRLALGSAGQVLRVNAGATAPEWGSGSITLGAAVASTTQTNIDFTGIPASARRITVMLAGVSTSGTSGPIVQLGDSGGIETTNYLGTESNSSGAATGSANLSSGFGIRSVLAANVIHGKMEICLVDPATNTWVATGMFGYSNSANTSYIGGSKSLSATLDRIRLTTAGGTDTFDAGTVNVSWE